MRTSLPANASTKESACARALFRLTEGGSEEFGRALIGVIPINDGGGVGLDPNSNWNREKGAVIASRTTAIPCSTLR